jgi:hypothetical protein
MVTPKTGLTLPGSPDGEFGENAVALGRTSRLAVGRGTTARQPYCRASSAPRPSLVGASTRCSRFGAKRLFRDIPNRRPTFVSESTLGGFRPSFGKEIGHLLNGRVGPLRARGSLRTQRDRGASGPSRNDFRHLARGRSYGRARSLGPGRPSRAPVRQSVSSSNRAAFRFTAKGPILGVQAVHVRMNFDGGYGLSATGSPTRQMEFGLVTMGRSARFSPKAHVGSPNLFLDRGEASIHRRRVP